MASNRREWSPALSGMNRRRNRDIDTKELLGLTGDLGLDDDDDFGIPKTPRKNKLPPGGAVRRNSAGAIDKKKYRDKRKKGRSISPIRKGRSLSRSVSPNLDDEEVPPEIAAKLAIAMDESQPMRRRVEVETEMRKNPEERKFLVNARYERHKQKVVESAENLSSEHDEQTAQNIKKEFQRAKLEKEEMDAERNKRIREAREKKARQVKRTSDIKKSQATAIAKDAEEFRKAAERMREGTKKNIKERRAEEEKHKAHKEKILAAEDSDVLRNLKEAVLDQVEVPDR
jgi:hypothetical protein